MGKYGVTFKPVTPDKTLKDQDKITLGNTILTLLHHPGHTKGSCSFIFETKDEKRKYRVLIANMPSVIVDKKFSEVTAYPNIQSDYAYTFKAMKNLDFDIWVASHASQFDLHENVKKEIRTIRNCLWISKAISKTLMIWKKLSRQNKKRFPR